MTFSIGIFDGTELISFALAFAALIIIVFLYFLKKPPKEEKELMRRQYKNLIFFIFIFIFLNRFLTNAEAIAYKQFFNLLEHLSSLIASIIAVRFSYMIMRSGPNR